MFKIDIDELSERNLSSYDDEKYDIDFTSNDYLDLKNDEGAIQNGISYVKKYGTSVTSSRLLGNNKMYQNLENYLSKLFRKDKTIIMQSGFQLNSSVVSTLLEFLQISETDIFTDKYIHNSIHFAILLENRKQNRFKHNDLDHLEDCLSKSEKKNKLIFTETIFSMEGSVVDIKRLIEIKKKYNALLYIDDAHGFGIFNNGYGLAYEYAEDIDFIFGTFSKAIASQGAFISLSNDAYKLLVNKCSGLIYSTGLNPFSLGVSEYFILNAHLFEEKRKKLFQNLQYIYTLIQKYKIPITNSHAHIIGIQVGSLKKVISLQNILEKEKIKARAIRAPSVLPGKEMIRICINSSHTKDQIDKLINTIFNFIENEY